MEHRTLKSTLQNITSSSLCLVLVATAWGESHEADLAWRTWCELRPYSINERLPLQEHRIYYTGLIDATEPVKGDNRQVIRETDPFPDWETLRVSRAGKSLTKKHCLDEIDGPGQFVVDPRVMKIYVSGYTPGPYRASYETGTRETQAAIRAADAPILRRGSVPRRRVPLIIEEPAGVDRLDWPITFGVPLPIGELASDRSVLIRDPQGKEIPCQVDTTGYWADGSVKWLTVDFQATVKAGRRVEYQVEYGNDVKPGVFESPLRVSDNADRVEIDTGPIRFSISKRRFNLFDQVGVDLDRDGKIAGEEIIASPSADGGAILTEPERQKYYLSKGYCIANAEQEEILKEMVPEHAVEYVTGQTAPQSVTVEVAGPTRATLRVQGWHVAQSGAKLFKYDVRYHAYAGSPMVRVYYTFTNAQDDQVPGNMRANIKGRYSYAESEIKGAGGYAKYFKVRWRLMRRLALGLPLHLKDGIHFAFGGDGDEVHEGDITTPPVEIYQDTHNTFNVYSGNEQVAGGKRLAGWMDLGNERWGLTIAVRHGWQQFPKSFIADGDTAIVELWSGRHEHHFEAFRGVGKRHELLFYFHPGGHQQAKSQAIAAGFQQPLIAPTPPRWVEKTKALGELGAFDPDLLRRYESSMDQAAAAYIGRRREEIPQRHYGMRDYGDSFCGAYRATMATGGKIGDNYWDDPGGNSWLNLEYDGTLTFLHEFSRRGDRRFFHEAEIAGRHWMDIDQCHYPPSRIGGQHVHGPQGMGYKPQSGGGHAWVEGLLAFGHLFADPRSHRMGLNHGSAKLRQRLPVKYDDGSGGITQYSREYGWPALAFLALYCDTWDQRHLEAARFYVETFLEVPEAWPYHAALPHMVKGAQGWMIQVMALPIIEYYRLTGDRRFARAIVRYAERILSDFAATETGHGGFTWVVEALGIAYEITGDDRYLTRAVGIFNNQTYGRRESKYMNVSTKRIPGAMAIMRRWCPRPSLALLLDPGRSKARVRVSLTTRPALGQHALRAELIDRDGAPAGSGGDERIEKFELDQPVWLAPDVSIEPDSDASGGAYVRFAQPLELRRFSRVNAQIGKAGKYQLMVRARLRQAGIMLRLDGGDWRETGTDVPAPDDGWRWFNLGDPAAVSAGEHEVQFKATAAGAEADLIAFVPAGRACAFVVPGGLALRGDSPATGVLECVNPLRRPQSLKLLWQDLPPGVRVDRSKQPLTVPGGGQAAAQFTVDVPRAPSKVALNCDVTRLSIMPGGREWVSVTVANQSDTTVRGRVEWDGLPNSLRPVPTAIGFALEPGGRETLRLSLVAGGHTNPGSVEATVRALCSAGSAWTQSQAMAPVTIETPPVTMPVIIEAERPVFSASDHYMKARENAYGEMIVWAGGDYYSVYDFQVDRTADYYAWARLRWPGVNTSDHKPEDTYTLRFQFDEADPPRLINPQMNTDARDTPERENRHDWHWTRADRAVTLAAGKHFVHVGNYQSRNRESDRYIITDDPNFRPSDESVTTHAPSPPSHHEKPAIKTALGAESPVFYEPFEGPASVEANGGTVTRGAFVRGFTGKGYVVLPGTDGKIKFPRIGDFFPVAQGTLELWVRPNWGTDDNKAHHFVTAQRFLEISRNGGGEFPSPRLYMLRGSGGKHSPNVPGWKAGRWHHLALVWHNDSVMGHAVGNHVHPAPVICYIDGEQRAAGWVEKKGAPPPKELLIGNADDGSVPCDAVLDELRIWKRALTAQEIRDRYEYGLTQLDN